MELPSRLAASVDQWKGPVALRWKDRLPGIIADAQRRWGISVGAPFEPGGANSFVAPASTSDGRNAVYKCTIPHPEAIGEADALEIYDGDGAVRMIESQPSTYELLVERCDPGSSLWDVENDADRNSIAAGLMRRLWRTAPAGSFGTLSAMTSQWADVTQRRLITADLPWVTGPIERGAGLLGSLPTSSSGDVLLHQDMHPGNILASRREPWLVIDPKPVVGDPAFDPIQLLVQRRDRTVEPGGHEAVARDLVDLAKLVGLDAERIGLWAIARCAEWSMWSWDHGNTIEAAITYTWARTLDAIIPA